MPRNTTVPIGTNWIQITDDNVAAITFQVTGENAVFIAGTVGAGAEPVEPDGLIYGPTRGEAGRPMTELFPGVPGANRIWARQVSAPSKVFVSHA